MFSNQCQTLVFIIFIIFAPFAFTEDEKIYRVHHPHISDDEVPQKYDTRTDPENPPSCAEVMADVPRQSKACGNCWAIASAVAMGQRYCKITRGVFNAVLSPLYITRCAQPGRNGCKSGNLNLVQMLFKKSGIVTGSTSSLRKTGCQADDLPYCPDVVPREPGCPSDKEEKLDPGFCSYLCSDGTRPSEAGLTMTETGYLRFTYNISTMERKKLILSHGAMMVTVCGSLVVNYTGHGIIEHDDPDCEVDHEAVVVGFGHYGMAPFKKLFWRILNSYSEKWGKSGTFKIRAGKNVMKIEESWSLPLFRRELPLPVRISRKLKYDSKLLHCFTIKGAKKCPLNKLTEAYSFEKVSYACYPAGSHIASMLERNSDAKIANHHSRITIERKEWQPLSCREV